MGSVYLDNVDDYLAPSQACINPLFTSDRSPSDKKGTAAANNSAGDGAGGDIVRGDNGDNGDNGDGSGDGIATKVKPRRMRVSRRKGGGGGGGSSRQSSTVSNTSSNNGGSSAELSHGDAMDVDTASRVVVSRKRPQRQQPIALTYQAHDRDDGELGAADQSHNTATEAAAVPTQTGAKATVSVADCLACSGCVTSSEAVMVQSHSVSTLRECIAKFFNKKEKRDKDDKEEVVVVFTISPASLADLIRHLYVRSSNESNVNSGGAEFPPPEEVLGRITTFLHQYFHATLVIDGTLVQQLALIESAEEFCSRYRAVQRMKDGDNGGGMDMDMDDSGGAASNKDFPMATPSIALSSTETRYLIQKEDTDSGDGGGIGIGNRLSTTEGIVVQHDPGRDARLDQPDAMATSSSPVVTSSCPGFVCYVEKTAPAVIPNLSTAKSPMACSGTLVKHFISSSSQLQSRNGENSAAASAAKIYHVAIMPCHDKKLEAGRKDLAWESGDDDDTVPDVDLVLTTSELLTLLSDAAAADGVSGNNEPGSIDMPSVGDEMDVDTKTSGRADTVRSFLERLVIIEPTDMLESAINEAAGGPILLAPTNRAVATGSAAGQTETVRMIGSGAYAEFCFRYAACSLFGYNTADETALPWKRVTRGGTVQEGSTNAPVPTRRRRAARRGSVAHSDMAEVVLYRLVDGSYSLQPEVSDGIQPQPVLKFATAYGFKNVQLVLMKLGKRGEAAGDIAAHTPEYYDFIEVMACPSGCLNGGGQIRDDEKGARRETPVETRERVGQNRSVMNAIGLRTSVDHSESASNVVSTTYRGESNKQAPLPSGPFGTEARKLLHTRFHVVPKLELSTGATAGVAIDDTVW